jgi:hypothetical protein
MRKCFALRPLCNIAAAGSDANGFGEAVAA